MLIFGPVTRDEVVAQIEKHHQNLPKRAPSERGFKAAVPALPTDDLSLRLPDMTRDQVLILGKAAPPLGFSRRKLWFSILLLGDILISAQHGGLIKPLYYDDFVVTDLSTRLYLLPTGEVGFEVLFRPEDGISTADSTKRVRAVLNDWATDGLPPETVQAVREQARAEVRRLEFDQAAYHATIAQSTLLNLGTALDVKAYHYEISQPDVDDLNLLLKSIVESQFATIAIAYPEISQ
ncbi:hypothetical protein TRL7639_04351 [Falsiruegeria litorea R37]|uniref:Peptidase M16 C-terminal domain-containing protein n=1 Tax=Falsiruegeria litorea R37 TaxID=1200284 RepID=A0A1Y5TZP8_9RHOB|nr:hypothetical protein TRL7639_04351 [Falsiruegeria litorea R37]